MKKQNYKNCFRIVTLLVAITILLIQACVKTDRLDFGKWIIQKDTTIKIGKVFYSTDNKQWIEIGNKKTIVTEGKYWFKAESNDTTQYQFNGWKQTDLPFPNESPTQVTINKNVILKPDFTIKKNEYNITLLPYITEGGATGIIEYALNDANTWQVLAVNAKVAVPKEQTIQFRVTTQTGNYFWGWVNLMGYNGIATTTEAITPTQDFMFTAEFKNYPPVKVAIKPIISPAGAGKIQWSTTETGTYTDLKTVAPYDSIFKTQFVYIKAVANDPYQLTTPPFTITETTNQVQPTANDAIYKAIINDEATITANFVEIKYTITLSPYTLEVPATGTGVAIQYAIDGSTTWTTLAVNSTVTIVKNQTIQFRATEAVPNNYFWGWINVAGNSTAKTTTVITPTQDFAFSAEFRNYPPIKVAIKPVITPIEVGKIQWSTTETGTYTDLKTAAPYDSLYISKAAFFKAVATNIYYEPDPTPFTITGGTITNATAPEVKKAQINSETIITAHFKKKQYTVTLGIIDFTGIKSIEYSTDGIIYQALPVTVDAGSDIWFKTTINNGYEFGEWTGNILTMVNTAGGNKNNNPTTKLIVTGEITATATALQQAIITIKAPTSGTLSYTLNGGAETPVTTDVQVIVPTGETLVVKATGNTAATPYSRFDKFNTTIATGTPGTFTTNIANQTATLSTYTGKLGDAFTIAADFVKQLKIEVPALPIGASAFTIAPNKNYATTAGYQPTLNTPVAAGNIAYIDDDTQFTATATPINSDPDYFRFKAWITPLTGTIGNQANTANIHTPTADMTVPLPTFQRQWKLTIVAPAAGSFNTGNTSFTTTPGNQPAAGTTATRLQSNVGRLEGYFDDNTSIAITSAPATNQKIRYSLNSAADAKITSFLITQNTTLQGTSNPLAYIDLFDHDQTLSSTSINASGNNEYFSALYTDPEGEIANNKNGKITFTINSSNQLTYMKIENTSTGGTYSGISEDFGVTATNPIFATIVSNVYSYALTTTTPLVDDGAGVFNVPAGTPITLQFTLIGDGSGSMQIQLIGSGPNGTIGINTISSTKP